MAPPKREQREVWDDAPIVVVQIPTCPMCGCEKYKPVRGWRSADGSRTSRRRCEACAAAYVVIAEKTCQSVASGCGQFE